MRAKRCGWIGLVFSLLPVAIDGCRTPQPPLPGAPAEPLEVWQEDVVAPVGSEAAVARVVRWSAWDVGRPRGGSAVFHAVAVANGRLEAPPEWTVYWTASREGEADHLARALAREVGAPPSALVPAAIEAIRLLRLDPERRDVETSEGREAVSVRDLAGTPRLLVVRAGGPGWRSRWTPSRELELEPLDMLFIHPALRSDPARPAWVTGQRLWLRAADLR